MDRPAADNPEVPADWPAPPAGVYSPSSGWPASEPAAPAAGRAAAADHVSIGQSRRYGPRGASGPGSGDPAAGAVRGRIVRVPHGRRPHPMIRSLARPAWGACALLALAAAPP